MEVVPLTLADAMRWLKNNARHYESDAKPLFALGLMKKGKLCGAAVAGTKNGDVELCHIYSTGEYQGYTTLYGHAWRACKALGYKRLIL